MNWTDSIFTLFAEHGGGAYFGEPVSQTGHALQAAHLAEKEGVSPALITAALLHDIGHLLNLQQHGTEQLSVDTMHEYRGSTWLRAWFGPEVFEPVRLHVDAKRYLCVSQPDYLDTLSPASVKSLGLQGGLFSAEEALSFPERPFAEDAIALRRWDELAKDIKAKTPDLDHFHKYVKTAHETARQVE